MSESKTRHFSKEVTYIRRLETGVTHNKQRLHKVKYFRELLSGSDEVMESIRPLLQLSRATIVRLQKTEYALVSSLQRDPFCRNHVLPQPDLRR